MSKVVFCVVVVFAVALNATNGSRQWPRIVDGELVPIMQYPYQAQLQLFGRHRCGGSIISEEYILTAAHCVWNYPEDRIKVRVGSTYYWKGGQLLQVSEGIVHPQYNSNITDYDLAVLKLSKKMIIDNNTTKVVKLAESGSSLTPGDYVKVAGWGTIKENGPYSEVLRALALPVISRDTCKELYENTRYKFTDRMFCAGFFEGGMDTCVGDSGGPVVHIESEVQYGIVSWAQGCARKGYPGVNTNIPVVRDWITQVTGV